MRIRSIRPEFWRSDDIAALSREDRLLFIGLWSYVDDNGVGLDDYRLVAADLFPLEEDQKEVRDYVREGLARLSRALLVVRYEVAGKAYLFIPTWDKHQRVDRPGQSRYPRPSGDDKPPTSGNADCDGLFDGLSRQTRDSLDAGEGEKGRRVSTSATATAAAKRDAARRFDEFWAIYPRKIKKEDARKAWRQVLARKVEPDRVIAAARAHVQRWAATGRETQFIPYPASWLRAGSYDDEPEQTHLTVVPALPADPDGAIGELRSRAAAIEAARLIGIAYIESPLPPSDPTPPREWSRARAVEFIDAHADDLRAALAGRRAAG
ncbi:MAG TPA: hypothetical protein VM307_09945 [Egibacteraceae bacterium]|jgi:hypothetical protein|nr:hypothetical protein [Egibacteraceae bacterium]